MRLNQSEQRVEGAICFRTGSCPGLHSISIDPGVKCAKPPNALCSPFCLLFGHRLRARCAQE
jgi:hypothetical protein